MFFTRTHNYQFSISREELKRRLIGKHVKIHNMDFEVLENENGALSIIPHAEQTDEIKTLPVTEIMFREGSGKTSVSVKSTMRQLDSGGPWLIVIFCSFLFIASAVLFAVAPNEEILTYTLLGVGLVIFTAFVIRMQMGYFDYVRKIHSYVKNGGTAVTAEAVATFA